MNLTLKLPVEIEVEGKFCGDNCKHLRSIGARESLLCALFVKSINRTEKAETLRCEVCLKTEKDAPKDLPAKKEAEKEVKK